MRKCSNFQTVKELVQNLSISLLDFSTEPTESSLYTKQSRSSILTSLNLGINSVGGKENLRRNNFWEQFLDERQLLSFEADFDSELDSENFMLELIIWMKAAIQTSNSISSNSIEKILENSLKTVPEKFYPLVENNKENEFRTEKKEKFNNVRKEQQNEFDSGIQEVYDSIHDNQISTINIQYVDKNQVLYNDEEASQISNPISFGGDDNVDEFKSFEGSKKFKRSNNEYTRKKLKIFEKIISPENVQFTLTKFQVDNYCLEILQKIINTLSYKQISKTIYRKASIHKAVCTIKNFINVSCKEKNSPIRIMDFYINPVVEFIKKLCDFSYFKHFEVHNREMYMQLILEFCDCKRVCIKTILFLMDELEQLIELKNELRKKNDYNQSNKTKEYFILRGLEIALKKYCLIEPISSVSSTPDLTNLWQRQIQVYLPRNEEELLEECFNLRCINKLTSLTNLKSDSYPKNTDEYIEELIGILSLKIK